MICVHGVGRNGRDFDVLGEALATTDSLWAAFRAGKAPASWLIEEARAMAEAWPDHYFLLADGESYHGRTLTGGRKNSSGPLVLKRELVQPGKGGAFAQVELRDLRGGSKLNERFRTQETVERVRLDEKEMQFLFLDGGLATFIDNDTFEQIPIPRETIG